MNYEDEGRIPADLARVAERLRSERATATALELDELKQRARRAARRRTSTEGRFMKSRIALTSLIVLGLLMSSTGATLAITGNSSEGNAVDAQYLDPQPEEGGDNGDGDPPIIGQGTNGGPTEATEQVVAASDDELPLTGFLAVPLIIGGVALLTSGAVLRWRVRDRE